MVHMYDLAVLGRIALKTGGTDCRSVFKWNAGHHSYCGFCSGLWRHCRCPGHLALCHSDVLCLHTPFLCIGHLLLPPTSHSYFWGPRPQAEYCPVYSCGLSHGLCGTSYLFSSPPLPCLSGGLCHLWAPTSQSYAVSVAVRELRLSVAIERALHCIEPYKIALMGAGAVRLWAVAVCWFATELAP